MSPGSNEIIVYMRVIIITYEIVTFDLIIVIRSLRSDFDEKQESVYLSEKHGADRPLCG